MRRNYLGIDMVSTIYFGGGTPSQLSREDLSRIFSTINNNYPVELTPEITIEANPDDLTADYAGQLATLPFNRISIGIQSLVDKELIFLNRRHTGKKAEQAVSICQDKGFNNINIDLIYGIPGQTTDSWKYSLEKAISMNVCHISAYNLIYEKGTQLFTLLNSGKIKNTGEDISIQMYHIMVEKLKEAGFIHYEISNFAKPDYISRHNSSYWQGEKYVGIGASAHSFDRNSRSWNISSISKYIEGIEKGDPYLEKEISDLKTAYNDYVLTRMRTMWGVNIKELEALFGNRLLEYFLKNISLYIENGNVKTDNGRICLTENSFLISDAIISNLMYLGK